MPKAEWLAIGALLISTGLMLQELRLAMDVRREWFLPLISILGAFFVGSTSPRVIRFLRKFTASRRVFVSTSSETGAIAKTIADKLREFGAKTWVDSERLVPGASFDRLIADAITDSDAMVVVVGETVGEHTRVEVELARSKGIRVVPVLVGNAVEVPEYLKEFQALDLRSSNVATDGEVEMLARVAVS